MRVNSAALVSRIERRGNRLHVPMTRKLGLIDLITRTYTQTEEDHVRAFAAGLAFRALFAGFAVLVLLFSLLGVFEATDFVATMLDRVSLAIPSAVRELLENEILNITRTRTQAIWWVSAVIAALASLWTMASGFRDISEALNVMYKVRDSRSYVRQMVVSGLLGLAIVGLQAGTLILVLLGSDLGGELAEKVGLGSIFQMVWKIVQWPVIIFVVLLTFALVYYYAPDVKQEFRFITPGSFVGVILWLCFTLLFLLFVNSFDMYNKVYGTLAGLAIHMLYTYYTAYILLLGAEINQVVEQHAPDGKVAGEKAPGVRAEKLDSESATRG